MITVWEEIAHDWIPLCVWQRLSPLLKTRKSDLENRPSVAPFSTVDSAPMGRLGRVFIHDDVGSEAIASYRLRLLRSTEASPMAMKIRSRLLRRLE